MRVLASLALFAAACGTEEGALLGFEGEPVTADRVEIVLASAKPDHHTTLASPRAGYFRQRINIDEVEGVGTLAGLTVRIEPDALEAPDEAFVVFVFAFEDDALVAVATFAGADGAPAPISIAPGEVHKFVLTVTPVTEVEPGDALAPSTGTVVECAGRSTWRSGYAWQPPNGPQLRVLLPDPALDAEMKSATMRASDLDCDGFAAGDDCDDLRPAIHPGAVEACDGVDSDCDGELLEVVSCAGAGMCASESVALCIDDGVARPPACIPDASCGCSTSSNAACTYCAFNHQLANGEKAACAPAVGKIHFQCSDCDVSVAAVTAPFSVTLGTAVEGPFSASVRSSGHVFIRAEQVATQTYTAGPGESIGELYLAVAQNSETWLLPVDLRFSEAPAYDGNCPSAGGLAGDLQMSCSP